MLIFGGAGTAAGHASDLIQLVFDLLRCFDLFDLLVVIMQNT